MSLTLPMETLSNMQVSFRVNLPDGKFAFDMASVKPSETQALQLEGGMKLHLRAVGDSTGITLTLCTSGKSNSRPSGGIERSVDTYSGQSLQPPIQVCGASGSSPKHLPAPSSDMDFLPYSNSELDPIPLESFGTGNRRFDLPDVPDDINSFLFDSLNFQYDYHDAVSNLAPGTPDTLAAGRSMLRHPSVQDFSSPPSTPFTSDTQVSTPSASSESSFDSSPAPQSRALRASLRCPKPACGRQFSKEYTLSKHLKIHEPKSQKSFNCTLGCAMSFSRKHDRLRHEVIQHGRLCEWRCEECLGFFSTEMTLKKHKCRNGGGSRWLNQQ
ncbi:hypothetical protein C8R43DRAFT_1033062 [Mycena crocata]|nr:hypothetical protein C8R43DRAFT_1033062 [Mycena crocata]